MISGPDIITRGFVYVKESEELMEELQERGHATLWTTAQHRQHHRLGRHQGRRSRTTCPASSIKRPSAIP